MIETIRIPPQNLAAERSVLGAVLLFNDAIDAIDLRPEEFYSVENQVIFATVREMWSTGCRAIDGVTLVEALRKRGKLEVSGGSGHIADLLDAVPHASHARYYANIVRQKSLQRNVINVCSDAIEKAYSGEFDEMIADLDSKLLGIREASTSGDIVTMADAVDALEERERNPAAIHSTGLVDLDRQIRGGLRDGQFMIVGGRPGSGKSVLAGQIANAFADRGEPALIVSLEMDRAEMAERYDKSIDRRTLRGLPIYMVDSAYEAGRIASLIRLAKRKHNIQIAVLDYLQLTESEDRKASRERQVAEVSRMMKRLAGELKIPVVAACQLNRNNDREQRMPRLSDLRESGSIEQDADIVLLLHQGDNGANAIVAKQRNGCTGVVPLTFRGDLFRFENHSNGFAFGSDTR